MICTFWDGENRFVLRRYGIGRMRRWVNKGYEDILLIRTHGRMGFIQGNCKQGSLMHGWIRKEYSKVSSIY